MNRNGQQGLFRGDVEDVQLATDNFQLFWRAYPAARRVKKERAWAAWERQIEQIPRSARDDIIGKMMAALEMQKRSKQWEDPRFIPHPASWLNARRWEDPVEGYADPERCPECGESWRVHRAYPSGPEDKPNAQGNFCPR